MLFFALHASTHGGVVVVLFLQYDAGLNLGTANLIGLSLDLKPLTLGIPSKP